MITNNFKIKKAGEEDTSTLLFFIKALADYEKLTDDVTANIELLKQSLFGEDSNTEALIAYLDDKPVGFALYFYNYSTFLGKRGLFLEDLFVLPEMRGRGFGKKIFFHLAKIARQKNCGRFEWSVLDWNEPAINFYKNMGAKPMDEWTIFRLDEKGIESLISENKNEINL